MFANGVGYFNLRLNVQKAYLWQILSVLQNQSSWVCPCLSLGSGWGSSLHCSNNHRLHACITQALVYGSRLQLSLYLSFPHPEVGQTNRVYYSHNLYIQLACYWLLQLHTHTTVHSILFAFICIQGSAWVINQVKVLI